MSSQRKWATGYLITFMVMIFLNYWSGTNVGSVADANQAIIQPAGFAFSIWGLIYMLLFAWIIKLFFSGDGSVTARLKFWPVFNFLLNGLWILVFTQQWLWASVIVIAGLLYTLVKMYAVLTGAGRYGFDRLPLSVYMGWVTIAAIVNIFALAVNNDVETFIGLGELPWTIIMLVFAALAGIAVALRFGDWLYPLVFIWPYFGIYAENDSMYMSLDTTLLITALALLAAAVMAVSRRQGGQPDRKSSG
ncbi:TspO/MBR family protein [Salinicoccus carnicancri]|uniref:TspO/MBR family protein n=1 Tax=Salinicoccus carnicancri TaxID=558170 RepID=UPI0002E88CF6|nr:TspO/MBR family protein [Salinicoccus carnicancri]